MLVFLVAVCAQALEMPNPVRWTSYDTAQKKLTFSWDPYQEADIYKVSYEYNSQTYYLPDITSTSASILCEANDGSFLSVWYTVKIGIETSPRSESVSMMCAGLPEDVPSLTYETFLNNVTLNWNAELQDGGSNLIGFKVYKKETSWELLEEVGPSVLSYTDTVSYGVRYNYKVVPYNWVGQAPGNTQIEVLVTQQASPQNTQIQKPTGTKSMYEFTVSVDLFDSEGNSVENSALMLLEVKDVCEVDQGYECQRLDSSDPNYSQDLLDESAYVRFEKTTGNSMEAKYTPLLDGDYILSVLQLYQGGLIGGYWDNIWFKDTISKEQIDPTINFKWEQEELITDYAGNFIGIKWIGFVQPQYSEEYTFYILADDGVQLYLQDNLLIDSWDSCCSEKHFAVDLEAGNFYSIKVVYKQLEGSAEVKLSWSSYSVGKQVIPSSSLYYPNRVSGSPWDQQVTVGKSYPELCYYTGETSARAGVASEISMYSVNARGETLDNADDVYSVNFSGPTSLTLSSTYQGNGKSSLSYVLTEAGTYSVDVRLYGTSIKDSPFSLSVSAGLPSYETSTSNLDSLGSIKAGSQATVSLSLRDSFSNTITEQVENLSLSIVFKENENYESPIGVPQPSDWIERFGRDYSGTYYYTYFTFTVFRAGNYDASILIEESPLAESPVELSITPSELYPEYCVLVFDSTKVIAGEAFSFKIQARDRFYNNLLITQSDLDSFELKATGPQEVSGSISDYAQGVFSAEFTLTKSGEYLLSVKLNSFEVPNTQSIQVEGNSVSASTSSVEDLPSSAVAGSSSEFKICSKDQYSNPISETPDTYEISIAGTNSLAFETSQTEDCITVTFVPTLSEEYQISVKLGMDYIQNAPYTFSAAVGRVQAIKSNFKNFQLSSEAGQGTLQIEARDSQGNLVSSPVNSQEMGSQYFFTSFSGPQEKTIQATYEEFDDFKVELSTLVMEGSYSVVLSLVEQGGLQGFYYKDQEFKNLERTRPTHDHASNFQFYTAVDPVIDFNWGTPSYFTDPIDFFSVVWKGYLRAIASETFTFYIQTDNRVKFVFDGETLLDNLNSGNPVTSLSTSKALVSSNFYQVELHYKSASGSSSVRLEWESTSVSRQVVPSAYLYSTLNSENGPYFLEVTPSQTDASKSTVSKYPSDSELTTANVGVEKLFLVETKDKYGNPNESTSDNISGTIKSSTASEQVTIEQESPGQYKGSFTLSQTGSYTLKVYLGSLLIDSKIVNVRPGDTDPSYTELVGVTNAEAGQTASFTVFLKDSGGNQQATGGDSVTISFEGPEEVPSNQISVLDNDDGSYSVKFKIYKVGSYELNVIVNGQEAAIETLSVSHTLPSPSRSTLDTPDSITLGEVLSVDLVLKDRFDNIINTDQLFYVYLEKQGNPNFKKLLLNVNPVDLTTGTFRGTAEFIKQNVDLSGECTTNPPADPSLCDFTGNLLLWGYVLTPKLYTQIYSNPEFSGAPSSIRLDSKVEFDWGQGTVDSISTAGISIIWSGFVVPEISSAYTFYIAADDQASVTFNYNTVMDSQAENSYTVDLSTIPYPVEIKYKNLEGTASVNWEWEHSSRQIVPASTLYHPQENLPISSNYHEITASN